MTVMVVGLLELLWLQQSVDEVDHEPHSDEARERIVEEHECLLTDGRRRRRSRSRPRKRQAQGPALYRPASDAPSHARFAQQTSLRGTAVDVAQRLSDPPECGSRGTSCISFRGGSRTDFIG